MRSKFLSEKLEKCKIPTYEKKRKQDTIEAVKNIDFQQKKKRMTNGEWIWVQIRFVEKKTWLLKLLLIVGLIAMVVLTQLDISNIVWLLISIVGPLMCLISANDICDIYQPGMREMQMTVKHSLQKVLMVRLLLFGIMDIAILLFGVCIINGFAAALLWELMLYVATPFTLMSGGCMYLLNRVKEENAMFYCSVWGVMLIAFLVLSHILDIRIIENQKIMIMLALFGIGVWKTIIEGKRILKNAGGNLDAIELGTFIQKI